MQAGHHKLLLPLGDRPVLVHVLTAALESQAHPIVVVLGHRATHIRSVLADHLPASNLSLLENPNYQQGMSTSLHTGINALVKQDVSANPDHASHQHVDSAMILLADQPLITSHIIDALIDTYQATKKPVVAPLYNGKRGNPVLFSASLFPELLTVTGDEGGRSVIQRHREDVASVEVGNVQASYDIDTWDAYQQVVVEWEQKGDKKG
jgi:molybdenum cofactor cytidylyltransferase